MTTILILLASHLVAAGAGYGLRAKIAAKLDAAKVTIAADINKL
jgi:hypothetical protein